jgi:hypothetical protein
MAGKPPWDTAPMFGIYGNDAEVLRDMKERRGQAIRKKLLIATIILIPLVLLFLPGNQNIYHDILPVLRESLPNTLHKVYWKVARQLQGQYPNTADTHYVEEYVRLNGEYRQMAASLQRERALGNSGATIERQLEKLGAEREALRPYAEAVVEQQVAAVVRDEGLLVKGLVLPPPKFIFADSYYILVTSLRREIRLEYTRLLGRDLSLTDQEEIEHRVEEENPDLAALVLPVGGLAAFYPAQIYFRGNLIRLMDLSVHEWLHQYLFVASPLGRTYLQGGRMRTINETVANMLGREIGEGVYLRYYDASPEEAAEMELAYREYLQELAARPASEPPSEGEEGFVFSSYMRETYLRAASLLEQGETEAAQTYMEERRRGLVQEGYNIRRLNQAYFAFYGTYADSPGAIDSIGPALARLRLKVASPADFLSIVKRIASYEDFLRVMEEQGIPVP